MDKKERLVAQWKREIEMNEVYRQALQHIKETAQKYNRRVFGTNFMADLHERLNGLPCKSEWWPHTVGVEDIVIYANAEKAKSVKTTAITIRMGINITRALKSIVSYKQTVANIDEKMKELAEADRRLHGFIDNVDGILKANEEMMACIERYNETVPFECRYKIDCSEPLYDC